MPTEQELPDPLKELAFRNGTELTHARWDSDVKLLIEDLKPFLDAPAPDPGASQPARDLPSVTTAGGTTPAGDRPTRRSLWAAGAAAVVAGAVSILGYHLWQDRPAEPIPPFANAQAPQPAGSQRGPDTTAAPLTVAAKPAPNPAAAQPSEPDPAAEQAKAEQAKAEQAKAAKAAAAKAAAARKEADDKRRREDAERAAQLAEEQRKRDEETNGAGAIREEANRGRASREATDRGRASRKTTDRFGASRRGQDLRGIRHSRYRQQAEQPSVGLHGADLGPELALVVARSAALSDPSDGQGVYGDDLQAAPGLTAD